MEHAKRLIFPIGEFTATLSSPELAYALARNHIREIKRFALYDRAPLFKEFTQYFYNQRLRLAKEGQPQLAYMCKILLNSLYGKWGQNGRKYEQAGNAADNSIKVWDEIDVKTQHVYSYRQFGGTIQLLSKEGEATESHPAIAAHITAYARLLLWDLIKQAGRNNVYYCDTDSILCNGFGYHNLYKRINADLFGALKLEKEVALAQIRTSKDYTLDSKDKIKGIRANAEILPDGAYLQDLFVSFKGMLPLGDLSTMRIKKVEKRLTRRYLKGIIGADGAITPIVLNG